MKKALLVTPEFEKFIATSSGGKRVLPSGKRVSQGTVVQYRMVYRLLREYEQMMGCSVRIALLHRCSMQVIRQEKNYWKRFFKRFADFLYSGKGYFDQYVGSVFKVLKTFFRYLLVEKAYPVGEYYRLFRAPAASVNPVVLSPEQLRRLITDRDFYEGLRPCLRRTLDIFIIGCTTGLRYSDLMRLRKTDLLENSDGAVLLLETAKTGTRVQIPLPEYALRIIEKYRRAGRYILPSLANSNFNLNIKEVIRLAGWDYILPRFRQKRGKLVEIRKPGGRSWLFYDHISAHTMRRTAITTLLLLGVDEHAVRRISGHAPGSREFYRYVALVQDYLDARVREAHRRVRRQNKLNFLLESVS